MPTPRKKLSRLPTDPWMTVREAARTLGVAPQTVYSRAAAGLLVTQVVAGRTFVRRDSVEALAAAAAVA